MEANLPTLYTLPSDQRTQHHSLFSSISSIKKIKPFLVSTMKTPSFLVKSSSSSSSSHDQTLKPKPQLKPNRTREIPDPTNTHFTKPSTPSSLGSRMEKLVVSKQFREALDLFDYIRLRGGGMLSATTYDSLVDACIGMRSAGEARSLFRHMIDTEFPFDQFFRNRVLLMHIKCGLISDARRLFNEMPERNVVSWNTMISGLVDSGDYEEALDLFMVMWEEVSEAATRTLASVIRACSGLGAVFAGSQLHCIAVKLGLYDDVFVLCALIDMYSKCGCIEEAQWVFDDMPEKTVVGWNTIIAGYALHGYSEEALEMYYEMQSCGVKMDHFTYSIVVRICARLGSLEHAKQAHAGLVRNGFGKDIVASTALVDLYCKWGRMEDARNIFDKMPCKNLISWNALIGGYATHGMGDEAIKMFDRMVTEGLIPNHVTYLAVLSACSYSGLLSKGQEIFESMARDPKTKPRAMHYACMIELLGREGLLDEALDLMKNAPFPPSTNMWAALLTACRFHKNLELGKFAAERLFGMEPEKLGNYIVLLNIYNSSGRTADAGKVLEALKKKGLRLLPACSWIEIKKQPHMFYSGDKSHPRSSEIYRKLDELEKEIVKEGNVSSGRCILPDVGEEEQRILSYHSEKLAIAFGLICTSGLTPLQVVQGHRLCEDCHNVIKLITVVTNRDIVVRDASRFHHFRHGACSCGEYW